MYDLSGKVALVTGAGGERGTGRAIATRLAQEGADVVVNDVSGNPYADSPSGWEGLAAVVREIEDLGRGALGLVADISDDAQVDNMVRRAVERFGHIDILVNNAGSRPGRDRVPVVDLEEDAWDEVQRVNVKGTFLCSRAVGREMIARGERGKIIIISSGAGKRGVARHRRLLRLQVRPDRLYPVPCAGAGLPQHQRQRHMPRLGGDRAIGLYRGGTGAGRGAAGGIPGPEGPAAS